MTMVTILLALLIGASLGLVGVAATAGALLHWRAGTLDITAAAWFGGLGAVGAMAGARLGRLMPAAWLMVAFAVIAVSAGLMLMSHLGLSVPRRGRRHPGLVMSTALGVGFLTGLLGVGGGFLIVPALALVLGLPMARAVGTSLAVIAVNCAAGLMAAATALEPAHVVVTFVFTGLALLGTLAGARTASHARPEMLRRAFGVLVIAVGVYTGAAVLI
jgi:uncharacterized membrane protein YfcA